MAREGEKDLSSSTITISFGLLVVLLFSVASSEQNLSDENLNKKNDCFYQQQKLTCKLNCSKQYGISIFPMFRDNLLLLL